MDFTFLGTSGWEQYPDIWCGCDDCEKARERGGKNIRANSCAWLAPDCLIDFPPQIFIQARQHNVDIRKAKYLLITHAHDDHFYPQWLLGRKIHMQANGNATKYATPYLKKLSIYGNGTVIEHINKLMKNEEFKYSVELNEIRMFEKYNLGHVSMIGIPANHYDEERQGVNYILSRNGKTILYALDSGYFLGETFEEIKKYKFDLVVLDAGNGNGDSAEPHCNFRAVEAILALFREHRLLKSGGYFCISHLSPHNTPLHEELASVMAKKGITAAYDGLKLNL